MSQRNPLTPAERAELARVHREEEDESMIRGFGSVYAYPMGTPDWGADRSGNTLAHPDGAVWLPEFEADDDRCLTIAEARGLAAALMAAADHAEYGDTPPEPALVVVLAYRYGLGYIREVCERALTPDGGVDPSTTFDDYVRDWGESEVKMGTTANSDSAPSGFAYTVPIG